MHHAGGAGDIPLIRADTRPMRVKPENPGGMQIPDRDMLIYGQQRPQVEHLLPPPEQPMARPSPASAASAAGAICAAGAGCDSRAAPNRSLFTNRAGCQPGATGRFAADAC